MDILLIAVLLVLAGFGLHGYLRGMVRVLFSISAIFLSVGLATAIAPGVTRFLQTQTPLYGTVKEKCTEYLQGALEEEVFRKTQEEDISVFGMKLPEELQMLIGENMAGQAEGAIRTSGIYEKVGDFAAGQIVCRLAWVLSFAVIIILLSIAVYFLDVLAKLPILKNINRAGGLAIGLLEGLAVVWILFLAAVLFQGSEFGREMMASIEGDPFLKLLYENNLLEHLVMGLG